ncbi:glycerol-3-phosphate transporter periplasmic binding protein [Serratia plymuthica]|uniref:Glycerol-3-phosphate transporter periplasmic binding protein n=1 Tax=Serratia plymuthica TaxID=82996 RepID=A0A2X4TQE1_SERPL|nr:glycerol-3-phosphate transporter periplasmic binding protein [Serratia plymuthica]
MLTYAIRKTTLCVALTLAVSTQALAATEIPFWHSMEGELGKEVDSLADRFNQSHSDVKIVPVYKGNYEQSLAAGIAAYRSGQGAGDFASLRSGHRHHDGEQSDQTGVSGV